MSDEKKYSTAFWEQAPIKIDSCRVLTCMACCTLFTWAMSTDPFFCPWCGYKNQKAAGYVHGIRSPFGEAEGGES